MGSLRVATHSFHDEVAHRQCRCRLFFSKTGERLAEPWIDEHRGASRFASDGTHALRAVVAASARETVQCQRSNERASIATLHAREKRASASQDERSNLCGNVVRKP